MHNFEYAAEKEWEKAKDELCLIIKLVQNEILNRFTFSYTFSGGSKEGMITCDPESGTGYDFQISILVNDPDGNYTAREVRYILRKAFDKVTHPGGFYTGYELSEDPSHILTLRIRDKKNPRIMNTCDFFILTDCDEERMQYMVYDKELNYYHWEYIPFFYLKIPKKVLWLKENGLWEQVRRLYLYNRNSDSTADRCPAHIFAETVNETWQKNREE